ncbi:hypothetical protein ES706_01086 [subsurface metagenome]|nr:DUF4263 domain-containing protein [Hadesarchaea archaeon]
MSLREKRVKYQITRDAPPAMEWRKYEQLIWGKWNKLLSSSTDEREFQKFLEQHPSLLPGAFGRLGGSGHTPFPSAVITKPLLPGIRTQVPDFLWIATDSDTTYPTLIELESPAKLWFTRNGQPSAKLTKARNQLNDWKVWFSENKSTFKESYHLPSILRRRFLRPHYVLVYGRREEASRTENITKKRSQLKRADEDLMTYDRLAPDRKYRNLMVVKVTPEGYDAAAVPPTLKLGPRLVKHHPIIANKDRAVANNPYISKERKKFLIERFPYWDKWARNGARYRFSPRDEE